MGDIKAFPAGNIIYISGPMTGYSDHNYPSFHASADWLRDMGYVVINPAENHGGQTNLPHDQYMRTDIPQVCESNYLFVLNGWEDSFGANVEMMVAAACKIPVFFEGELPSEARLLEPPEILFWDQNGVAVESEAISSTLDVSTCICGFPSAACGHSSYAVSDVPQS